MKTYYIYHIPNFVRKDGLIGKIGCTSMSIEERAAQQGYTEVELLETHTDIYVASDREIELQIQYFGKKDNSLPYWKSVEARKKGSIEGGRIVGRIYGGKNFTTEIRSKGGKIGGIKSGIKNIESGHISNLGKVHGKINGKLNGKISQQHLYTCPHCSTPMKGPNYFRYHGDRCKQKKD